MKRYSEKGAITVFLSLVCILFLSLLCTAVESARVQGCRAKAAAALDMGMFSVLGEFERELLDEYDVFFLDGAAGSGSYSTDALSGTLADYMAYNVDPNKGYLLSGFDPFGIQMTEARITGIGLATDGQGEAFYQQAVGYMRENLATEVISSWMERKKEGEELEKAGELYEKRDGDITKELASLEEQRDQMEQQQKESGETGSEAQLPAVPESRNPLNIIKKLKNEGILGVVLKDKGAISQKALASDCPSRRGLRTGNLPVEKKYGGVVDDLIFQEYLFERFTLFTDQEEDQVLDYGLEYILCGKNSDEKNLKSTVVKLLLLREGSNFVYLTNDTVSMGAAEAMAAGLVGWIPLPGLVTATAYALLLAWAYGESLIDVRELLAGGRVPVLKSADTWKLDLASLADIVYILNGVDGSSEEGLSYASYLQILFTLGNHRKYAMRALDLVEGHMRRRAATSAFRVDNAIFKIQAQADFVIPPLFLRVSNAFLKTGLTETDYHVSGSYAY